MGKAEQEKKRFIELADRLTGTRDPEKQRRLKEELARMTFGEDWSRPVAGSSHRSPETN